MGPRKSKHIKKVYIIPKKYTKEASTQTENKKCSNITIQTDDNDNKITCSICDGQYTKSGKNSHERTKKHKNDLILIKQYDKYDDDILKCVFMHYQMNNLNLIHFINDRTHMIKYILRNNIDIDQVILIIKKDIMKLQNDIHNNNLPIKFHDKDDCIKTI